MGRDICAVDGCKSSKIRNKNLSFFHLPVDEEIRKTWIELIGRPDLAKPETKRTSHCVCSLHFDSSVIKYKPILLANSLPTKLLPSQPTTSDSSNETETKESSTQSNYSTVNISAVTVKSAEIKCESVQIAKALSSSITPRKRRKRKLSTPRKRKLSKD